MRRLPSFVRFAMLALATLQLASGAALAVADGLNRARDVALAAHVEDQGATHKSRSHSHDCMACRELRAGCVAPPSAPAVTTFEQRSTVAARALAAALDQLEHALCARAPPVGIV